MATQATQPRAPLKLLQNVKDFNRRTGEAKRGQNVHANLTETPNSSRELTNTVSETGCGRRRGVLQSKGA